MLIVGGGPSGLATALFLQVAAPELTGRIVVLEKEKYPREKFCAGAVGARAEAALRAIGVTVDVPSVAIDALAVRAQGRTRTVESRAAGRVVRRIEFDHALARVAIERGIDLRDGVRATGLALRPDGVTVETSAGPIDADVLVGADGVSGFVRKALGIPKASYRAQAVEVDTEPVASDLPRSTILFDLGDESYPGYYWDFPTVVNGENLVCRGVYYLKTFAERPTEIDDILTRELEVRGLDPSRYKRKRYAEQGFSRGVPVSAHRVLLVGEAAGIDPVTGEGIAQAILYGAAAGPYLARKLRAANVNFSDFPGALASASIGRDLLVRSACLPLAYGRYRSAIEKYLLETPEFLEVGLAHFAGRPFPRRALGRAAIRAAAATAKGLLAPDGLSRGREPRLR